MMVHSHSNTHHSDIDVKIVQLLWQTEELLARVRQRSRLTLRVQERIDMLRMSDRTRLSVVVAQKNNRHKDPLIN